MKLPKVLGIISILGFTSIIVYNSVQVDISNWVNSLLFILIGLALLTTGGYQMLFQYFKDGFTVDEINKTITLIIGALSCVIGVLMIFGINLDNFSGVKIIVSFIAITVIAYETWGRKK